VTSPDSGFPNFHKAAYTLRIIHEVLVILSFRRTTVFKLLVLLKREISPLPQSFPILPEISEPYLEDIAIHDLCLLAFFRFL
jgi:hypothetical protein